MAVEIYQESLDYLERYASISIAFQVNSIFEIIDDDRKPGEFLLQERAIDRPYVKDYDSIESEHPTLWPDRFDMSKWGLLVARSQDQLCGGAVVAFDTAGVDMLAGRRDLAVLWDIRVSTAFRGQGVGSALFQAVAEWARARGCSQLKMETQNINVPACRFYANQGCQLLAVNRGIYPELPDEIQMLWYKNL